MTAETLNEQFKHHGKKSRDFIKWAASKGEGVKIYDMTISRQRGGKQGITESFALCYVCFFEQCQMERDEIQKAKQIHK